MLKVEGLGCLNLLIFDDYGFSSWNSFCDIKFKLVLGREVEAVEERGEFKEQQSKILCFISLWQFVEQEVCILKKVCQACQGAKGQVLYHASLRCHAHLLEGLWRFLKSKRDLTTKGAIQQRKRGKTKKEISFLSHNPPPPFNPLSLYEMIMGLSSLDQEKKTHFRTRIFFLPASEEEEELLSLD